MLQKNYTDRLLPRLPASQLNIIGSAKIKLLFSFQKYCKVG